MSPVPPAPRPNHQLPPFHLRCEDLSEPGSIVFFQNIDSDVHAIVKRSAQQVLDALYPPELHRAYNSGQLEGREAPGPKPVRSMTLVIRGMDGVAHTKGTRLDDQHKEIHLSTSYLQKIDPSRRRHEIEGVLVHELVHVFQHNANGTCNGGLIEGIADWVRLGAGLGPPHWRMGGDRWDQGYDVTAFFLAFLSKYLKDDLFVPKLNLAMRDADWNNGELLKKQLGGKDVDDLWKIYRKSVDEGDKKEGITPPAVPTHAA